MMTPPLSGPPGATAVQGWMALAEFRDPFEMIVCNSEAGAMAHAGDADADLDAIIPVAITVLALDASGQRAIPDELVERCARAYYDGVERRTTVAPWDGLNEDAAESCRETARAVLQAALGTGGET